MEALDAIESIRVQELEKRGQVAMYAPQSCESLLRKRQEELAGAVNDDMSMSSRFELDEISNVLKEALGDDCIREAIENKIIQLYTGIVMLFMRTHI